MSLPRDLLAQAQLLATKEPRRPKGASLRRAVSTAYYALFHLLTDEASRFLISGSNRDSLRNLVARGFTHSEMGRTAKAFLSGYGGLTQHIRNIISEPSEYPDELDAVAAAFYDLQRARHTADYDLSARLTRDETLTLVRLAETAFADWEKIRTHEAARIFLVALLMNDRWKRQ
ncbi:MAG: hypothetical protein LGR52_11500 [Candidatus Thiosymbion ectosymbiont of Robbea hypermnestra]|nr:hypothetical protein [Candidatus Thiosymbion ectosymbiont of Robbea hypermnestra]